MQCVSLRRSCSAPAGVFFRSSGVEHRARCCRLGEIITTYEAMFDNSDQIIERVIKGVEARISNNRSDTTRIKAEIAELDKPSSGITRLLVFGNGANGIAMLACVFVPEVANLGNDRVFCHGSSSGVHITGAAKIGCTHMPSGAKKKPGGIIRRAFSCSVSEPPN